MAGIRTWACPTLCGCQLTITALWPDGPPNSPEYRYPIPDTISSIGIVSACASHDHFRTDPPITDWTYGGKMSGYLRREPITEAEKLFVGLTRYSGGVLALDTCGCRIYQTYDRTTGEIVPAPHPQHTHKSSCHALDTDTHDAALSENRTKNRVVPLAEATWPAAGVNWSFDAQRKLHLQIRSATIADKDAAARTLETTLSLPNRSVVID